MEDLPNEAGGGPFEALLTPTPTPMAVAAQLEAVRRLSVLTLLVHGDFARTVAHCASTGSQIACTTLPGGRNLYFVTSPDMAASMTNELAAQFSARQDEAAGGQGVVSAVGTDWAVRRALLQPLKSPVILEALVATACHKHLRSLPAGAMSLPPPMLLAHCRLFSQRVMHEILFSSQPPDAMLPEPLQFGVQRPRTRWGGTGARRRQLLLRLGRARLALTQLYGLLRGRRISFFELAGACNLNQPP